MTTLMTAEPVEAPTEPPADLPRQPEPHRWTREEYYQMAEAGFFGDRKVMLIEGEVFVMSPVNEPHVRGIIFSEQALRAAFGADVTFRTQAPIDLGRSSDPEPDIAVIAGPPRSQPPTRPTTALLIVEVSDSSLAYDVGEKASLYAAAGIADYWVLDLVHNRLIVLRDPRPDPAARHGHSYFQHLFHAPADSVAPLAAPNTPVAVADLLP